MLALTSVYVIGCIALVAFIFYLYWERSKLSKLLASLQENQDQGSRDQGNQDQGSRDNEG